MSETNGRYTCACLAAGRPLQCRSCVRRVGLQQRRRRPGFEPLDPGTPRLVRVRLATT